MANYEDKAIAYAERFGIVTYRVDGNIMIFNVSFQAYLQNKRYTIQHRVNLDTGVDTPVQLKKFDVKGYNNRG